MAFRATYWSNTKLADWIRGTPKPTDATSPGWTAWRNEAKAAHKIRYWIAEDALDEIQNIVYWPVDKFRALRYYVDNRFVAKTHAMTSTMQRGHWHEFDSRLLHCSFDTLVDFVEIEQAWHHVAWDDEARKKYGTPKWRPFRSAWRCPEAGVAYLTWASSLVIDDSMGANVGDPEYGLPTQQAMAAIETLTLYHWWKHIRPARPDPYDESGWTALCVNRGNSILDRSNETPADRQKINLTHDHLRELEQAYEEEDTVMLKRLVDLRRSLWT